MLRADVGSIIRETEAVRAGFEIPGDLVRADGNGGKRRTSNVGMIVTTRRLLFVPTDCTRVESESDVGVLCYHGLARVSVAGSDERLVLGRTDGVEWHAGLPAHRSDAVDATVRHLDWIGELRSRLVACRNDVELAAGEIRDHASAMEWDQAERKYEQIRDRLDRIIDAVHRTEPIATPDVAPGLTGMERTLEGAYAKLQIERATSELTLGQQLVRNGDYEQAATVLSTAHAFHEIARDRAAAVERGDAFQFGPQRELDEDLERLEWEIEAVGAEPLRQAHEAKMLARSTSDPTEGVDHWETAFRRYGSVLALEPGEDERYLAGDPTEIRGEMGAAGEALVDHHGELARRAREAGQGDYEAGDVKSALRSFGDARDHLDRALELAAEFRPHLVPKYEDRLERLGDAEWTVREGASSAREAATRESPNGADCGGGSSTGDSGSDDAERGEPSLETLADIDTHHEIVLEDPDRRDGSTGSDSTVTADAAGEHASDGPSDRIVESDSE